MADKYLNLNVLTYFWNRLKTYFVSKDDQTNVEFNTSSSPYSATITQGTRSISFTNTDNGVSLYALDGGTSTGVITKELADKNYVDNNGGKIDRIKVNRVEQTIINKTADLEVVSIEWETDRAKIMKAGGLSSAIEFIDQTEGVELAFGKGSSTSQTYVYKTLVDKAYVDGNFQTEAQVQALIDSELADITGIDFQVVQTLPASGVKGTIYLVPKTASTDDIYDEYIWLTPEGQTAHWELIGTTAVDLSNYWSMTDLVAITTAEIDTMMAS